MKKRTKRMVSGMLVGIMSMGLLAGCGSKSDTESKEEKQEVETVTVASINYFPPQASIDDDGNPVGFEYALLEKIDELLPQYEFEMQALDYEGMFAALETGKVDLVTSILNKTPEREETYLFANEPYVSYSSYIAVLADNTEIQTVEDLAGKKILLNGEGSVESVAFEEYNEQNPDKAVELIYDTSGGSAEVQLMELQNGVYDALMSSKSICDSMNEAYGDGKDVVRLLDDPWTTDDCYYVYHKGSEALRDAIDEALRTLKENGVIEQLLIEYWGTADGQIELPTK